MGRRPDRRIGTLPGLETGHFPGSRQPSRQAPKPASPRLDPRGPGRLARLRDPPRLSRRSGDRPALHGRLRIHLAHRNRRRNRPPRFQHPATRKLAPDFTLPDASGTPIRLSALQGKVVLLNFWATWCPPCKREIPWFVEFQAAHSNLAVLGVSLDEDGWTSVKPFLARNAINYPIMVGGEDLTRLYGGLDSLPTTLVIDKQGRIAATHVGLVTRSAYQADLEAVLAEP